MNRLHSCSTITIGLIRKLLVHVVRDAFYVRFGFRCPRHLQRIRDLSLLPHILHTNRCWMDLYFSEVASLFEMRENDFEVFYQVRISYNRRFDNIYLSNYSKEARIYKKRI